MKVSNKEKNILIILVTILVVVMYYQIPYRKEISKLKGVKENKLKVEERLTSYKGDIDNIEETEKDIKILNSKIQDRTMRLYPYIKDEKILLQLDELIKKSKLEVKLSFQQEGKEEKGEGKGTSYDSMLKLVEEYKKLNKEDKDKKIKFDKNTLKVTLSFNGTYDNLETFLNDICNGGKTIFVDDIKINSGQGKINGTMNLNFLAIPKITREDEEYDKWPFNNSYGKANPFDMQSGNSGISKGTIESNSLVPRDNYDFVMAVRPLSSDLPTLSLGKAQDNSRKTYIYCDSNEEETVDINIEKKEDKYFYKYKSKNGSYPRDYDSAMEFQPMGSEIVLKIFSTKKTDDKDGSSVNLRISNNTDKTVRIIIEGEENTSRIKVNSQGSNVEITKK